ncbi:MAG TPA: Ig-like domain-containing protein, partial [Terriglobales bacterium]|nr:Ig-like domain-containing protein [Terriglobales bacterium]
MTTKKFFLLITLFIAAQPATAAAQSDNSSFSPQHKTKAPVVIPSKPFDRSGEKLRREKLSRERSQLSSTQLASLASASTDTTPPIAPTQVTASAQGITTINAQWDSGSDPESGISYYIFGIGTNSSGDYSTLANVRWWQVVYANSMSVGLNLDPSLIYYVSVYAVNGAGLWSSVVISNPVQPVWTNLGQPGNVIQLQFGDTGYDANGNPTSTFTADEMAVMTSFFNNMYPILVQLYGPPAVSYTLTVVRDLRYQRTNEFIPSLNQMRKDDNFYPQLFTHELVHAFRDTYILSADQNWNFDPTLDGFEEGFAQGVSYDAMNRYVATYPSDTIVPQNSLWGSSNDWDYDFQNMLVLRGTDFWSDSGGTGLYWLKYEMAAAAIRKINLESPGFYKAFNQQYYSLINSNPMTVRPTRALVVGIIKGLMQQIEGISADQWINLQYIFYCQNVYGEKIYHRIQDYQWTQFFSFQSLYFLNTMSCGSEWACWNGSAWAYYDLNGSQGTGDLLDASGNTVWTGNLSIQPSQNPSDGYYAFGSAAMGLTTASSLQPWPGGDPSTYIMNLDTLGLYRFDSSFTDSTTGATTTDYIYRVMGSQIENNFSGVWGGVLGHKNGTIYLDHEGLAPEPGLQLVNGAFVGTRSWTGIPNTRTGGTDSLPGRVFITFTDGGATYHAQRNIDYGSSAGSQMFLFDFTAPPPDTTPPTVSVTSPSASATVFGTVTFAASAADNVGVARVQFAVDGQNVGAQLTSAPYTMAWDSTAVGDGSHNITAAAWDSAGNTALSSPVTVVVDNSAPTVSLTSPTNGSVVTGIVPAAASASALVSQVAFYVDGTTLIGTASSAPYSVSWNTSGLVQGSSHTVSAVAYGINGKTATSSGVTVAILDTTPPTVAITSPANNASVSGTVTVSASASDNVGVAKVEFYVDGALLTTSASSPYTAVWNTNTVLLGTHTLTAKAYDLSNNSTISGAVSVNAVDTIPPTVAIINPANNASVSGTVSVSASASDNVGVAKV